MQAQALVTRTALVILSVLAFAPPLWAAPPGAVERVTRRAAAVVARSDCPVVFAGAGASTLVTDGNRDRLVREIAASLASVAWELVCDTSTEHEPLETGALAASEATSERSFARDLLQTGDSVVPTSWIRASDGALLRGHAVVRGAAHTLLFESLLSACCPSAAARGVLPYISLVARQTIDFFFDSVKGEEVGQNWILVGAGGRGQVVRAVLRLSTPADASFRIGDGLEASGINADGVIAVKIPLSDVRRFAEAGSSTRAIVELILQGQTGFVRRIRLPITLAFHDVRVRQAGEPAPH